MSKKDEKKELTPAQAAEVERKGRLSPAEKFQEVMKQINKQYGAGSIALVDEVDSLLMPRIEVGIFALDLAIGGGLPVGRVAMFYGGFSSAKTSKAMRATAKFQRTCFRCFKLGKWSKEEVIDKKTGVVTYKHKVWCETCKEKFKECQVAWIDAEHAFDTYWASVLGVMLDKLVIMQPETAEQTVDMVDNLMRTGYVNLMVIDSLAQLTPKEEIEKSSEKWQQGLQARLLNKMCRKINSAMNEIGRTHGIAPTTILINQSRMKIGVMFGNPETKPGGMGQDFITSIEVRCGKGPTEMDKDENTKDEDKSTKQLFKPLYQDQSFTVVKNKTAPNGIEGIYRVVMSDTEFHKAGDIADEDLVIQMAIRYGIIKAGEKAHKYVFGDEPMQKSQIALALMKDRVAYEKLKADVAMHFRAV